ncbi:hypothetical protein GBA52_004499 [Prunus armeniaca]|nr:hypothetical protein GBA52_004499 [Prunus armeniaca]
MVIHSGVLRMAELIPILVEYIKSRQVPGWHVILAAHNARCFDVPFLLKEFSCCSFDVPLDWLFLDTLAMARELRKLHGLLRHRPAILREQEHEEELKPQAFCRFLFLFNSIAL